MLRGCGELCLRELAAGADPGLGSRPAGEAGGSGEQRSGQRVPCQLGLGVQPHRRQGGALCGHQGVLLGAVLRLGSGAARRDGQSPPLTESGWAAAPA